MKIGMTNSEALRSATTNASELLGIEIDLGSLEPGKFADLIAVRGNPLVDIGCLAGRFHSS